MNYFNTKRSILISLDVNDILFETLTEIAKTDCIVEINSTDKQLLKQVVQEFPQIKIGAANIINSQELERCCESGVAFVSSPGLLPTLAQTATIYNMNYIPGI